MKKQILMSLIATLVTVSASASTKIVCAVNGENKPNDYSRLLVTKTIDLENETKSELLYTFDNGDQAYVALVPQNGLMVSIAIGQAGKTFDVSMAQGLQNQSYVGTISSAHKAAVVCSVLQ